ncbi:MAG TPA: YihY/virulence factor BrkB family protein [Bryobacteraceae bacterium]|nr:YihY/virulence factor BrkB family protein [Bryobacteraceae bacterium]
MRLISLKEIATLFTITIHNWQEDRAPRLGAALAYYMALSLAPALLILLSISGFAFGTNAAEGHLVSQIQSLVGVEGAKVIHALLKGTHQPSSGITATVLALVTLFFSATAVVSELKDALNTIWKVPEDTTCSRVRSMLNVVTERLLSFVLVLGAGLFLLASLIVNVWISAADQFLTSVAAPPRALIQTADWVVSLTVITVLFAFIFKVLPKVPMKWEDVTVGAVFTSLLFTAGKSLLGVYLGKASFTDTYGAASSLVIVLVWVYYSAQVFYLGAEFTRAYACHREQMSTGLSGGA